MSTVHALETEDTARRKFRIEAAANTPGASLKVTVTSANGAQSPVNLNAADQRELFFWLARHVAKAPEQDT